MPNQLRDDLHAVDVKTYPYIFEQNASVKLEGVAGIIRCNVYRPKNVQKAPVIITYGPYGKDTPYGDFLAHSFHDINPKHKTVPEHSAFETPDPPFWTSQGFAVVRADEVGIGQSPGSMNTMSKSTTDAFVQLIEWAADQPWSNGKIGLLGISYFAGSQWRVAARRPRGLACIIPYEGMADYYRDRVRHGGLLTAFFLKFWHDRQCKSNQYGLPNKSKSQRGPDTIEGDLSQEELDRNRHDQDIEAAQHFFRDEDYYASREYNLLDIEVPVLSVGNWGNTVVHLRGNIEGYAQAGSKLKFLRLGVGRHDLPFYADHEVEVQKSFMSAFLLGDDYAGWTTGKQPNVSYKLRKGDVKYDSPKTWANESYQSAEASEWPIPGTTYQKFYLHPDLSLSSEKPDVLVHDRLSYPTLTKPEDEKYVRFFTDSFNQECEFTGHVVARVNVSATSTIGSPVPKDIDIFLTLRHWDVHGKEKLYTGSIGDPVPVTKGWQRVSLRKINDKHPLHRDYRPHRDFFSTDVQPVIPGEVYPVDVEVIATNVVVSKGEKLSFEISGGDTQGVGIFHHDSPERNVERFGKLNHIHFSPEYVNYVSLPLIPK
ncbi:hypothetical protein BAUCODRAFT_120063 [Baudoinia panamericana UAMH 10762]|uniref:Xaa-Pro dipeptidyl-peptidase C-terminal domain-containing protein n=1 Tax=Baudoinia panamericana (strain UAMH 10762) TaxID=717646 RepID=M2MPS2_BAUPA|nr:uncharacterized protein BAUCODRAFT_120063 [Baudoinia panamericana UAMH 10762]EMC98761.1 hypothetical protein BAUCODRAFT_120063 [Baudoinia panamericana UAMH 10762]